MGKIWGFDMGIGRKSWRAPFGTLPMAQQIEPKCQHTDLVAVLPLGSWPHHGRQRPRYGDLAMTAYCVGARAHVAAYCVVRSRCTPLPQVNASVWRQYIEGIPHHRFR